MSAGQASCAATLRRRRSAPIPRASEGAARVCERRNRDTSHEALQRGRLLARCLQAKLRAPPHYVVGGLRPFLAHQITHLGGGEVAGEALAEIGEAARVAEHAIEPRAVV